MHRCTFITLCEELNSLQETIDRYNCELSTAANQVRNAELESRLMLEYQRIVEQFRRQFAEEIEVQVLPQLTVEKML